MSLVNPGLIGGIAILVSVVGTLIGTRLRLRLQREHLEGESREVIKLGIGLTATVTALVLGLVTASAKTSFDAVDTAVKEAATKLLVIDRTLARYGPEAATLRVELKAVVEERVHMIWPTETARPLNLDPTASGKALRVERLVDAIRALDTGDELKAALQARAAGLAEEVLEARWMAMAGTGSSVPALFLVVVMSWLTLIFAIYGMLADNRTAVVVLIVCAFSIGCALFLVLELDAPFNGLIRVAGEPLYYAIAHMNR
jgi:Protein of unknown function (DUF4239)